MDVHFCHVLTRMGRHMEGTIAKQSFNAIITFSVTVALLTFVWWKGIHAVP